MECDSDTIALVAYRRPRGEGRDLRRKNYSTMIGGSATDTEMARENDAEEAEMNGYFSETVSLPSVRAHLASSMRCRETSRDDKENTPLLMDTRLHETEPSGDGQNTGKFMEGYTSVGVSSGKKSRAALAKLWYSRVKIAVLALFVVLCVVLFSVNKEDDNNYFFVTVHSNAPESKRYSENQAKKWESVTITLYGPFEDQSFHNDSSDSNGSNLNNNSNCDNYVFLCETNGDMIPNDCPDIEHVWKSKCESVRLIEGFNSTSARYTTIKRTLDMDDSHDFTIAFSTGNTELVEFQVSVHGEVIEESFQVILSAVILVIVYILIAFDIVHRTLAAMIGSTCVLGVLSMLHKRPTLEGVVDWIDLDTICLLFGMMTLVAIFSQTGFFDYCAVKMYKMAKGKIWPLITLLCIFSAVVSAFLDNVTTILLLTPVSIRLCQVLNLDPKPVLIAEVVFSNIGGTATAIGDPPNVIIISSDLIKNAGIEFPEFTLHLSLGIILCMFVAYGLLTVIYYCHYVRLVNKDPPHISELKREIAIWERTARRLPVISLEERAVRDALRAKANEVRMQLTQQMNVSMQSAMDVWQRNLAQLEGKYRITNKVLLVKSSIVLLVVILLFFLSNTIPKVELELGWIAIFGAVVLLILADIQELESVLQKIEWGTLLFFAALFILMEGLAELGLIKFIGDTMVNVIKEVPKEHQMLVSIILVVWVSALASSFIDNIPFTTAMIPVIVDLANSDVVCLSIKPLVWALAFGACLGGNGTLIGASANVVCAGIAEQNGYRISFKDFFRLGFPMMLVTVFTAMIYLLICHSAAQWNTQEATDCVATYS